MKIKEVCQQTGLTDRAIRYYIKEGLVSPDYTENYLGRRTFFFSQEDVSRLNEIAVLRKFGFAIVEIRDMYAHPDRIDGILCTLIERKECAIESEQELLRILTGSQTEHVQSVRELVTALSKPAALPPLPREDERSASLSLRRTLRFVGMFFLSWAPIAACIVGFFHRFQIFHFPVFSLGGLIVTLLTLLPTILLRLYPRLPIKEPRKKTTKPFLILFCVLSILPCYLTSLTIIDRSESHDFREYRRFDPDCLANRSSLFQDLFPTWANYFVNNENDNAVYLDAHYLYRYLPGFDYTYDIYAEWPLEKETFDEEVSRARAVMAAHRPEEDSYQNYVEMQKGNYHCMIIYHGNAPFEQVTDSYTYCIFAYNEEERRVRYLYCDSLDNGQYQPYYLELAWN